MGRVNWEEDNRIGGGRIMKLKHSQGKGGKLIFSGILFLKIAEKIMLVIITYNPY